MYFRSPLHAHAHAHAHARAHIYVYILRVYATGQSAMLWIWIWIIATYSIPGFEFAPSTAFKVAAVPVEHHTRGFMKSNRCTVTVSINGWPTSPWLANEPANEPDARRYYTHAAETAKENEGDRMKRPSQAGRSDTGASDQCQFCC